MFRRFIACLLVCLSVCSPAYAASTTDSMYRLMTLNDDGIAPAYVYSSDIRVYASLSAYSERLQSSVADFFSDFLILSTPGNEFFKGTSNNRRYLVTDNIVTDADYAVCSLVFDSSDETPISATDLSLGIGGLTFQLHLANSNGVFYDYLVNQNLIKRITYQVANGTSYDSASFGAEYNLPVSSSSGFAGGVSSGNGMFLATIPCVSDIISSGNSVSLLSTYKIKVNFYIEHDLLSYGFRGGLVGFSNIDDCYVSYRLVGTPSDSENNQQIIGGLDNINLGIQNLGLEIQNMTNSIISQISSSMSQLSQTVQSVTQSVVELGTEINNTVTQQTQEIREALGLVGDSIDSGITNIQNSINNQITEMKDGFENVTNEVSEGFDRTVESVDKGFEETKKEISELPGKIKNMLTDFFVPDEDTVSDKMSDFQSLAEEKLGIIYQVPEMMFDAFDALANGVVNPQSTMTFPAFSLPWIDGSSLRVWDSQEFEIIPSGLDNLRDLIQTVTSMVFVIMTFNSLKRAYERFFLGGDD